MSTSPKLEPKRSELWQRIRAARDYAKLTRNQAGKAVGLTGPAISLWESRLPHNRSIPRTENLVEFAKACNISVQFLLDDSARPEDVYTYGSTEEIRTPRASLTDAERQERASAAFWSAVKFAVVAEHPELDDAFDVEVKISGVPSKISFLKGDHLVMFGRPGVSVDALAGEVGNLLVMERAAGHPYVKHLFRWAPAGAGVKHNLAQSFDIDLRSFSDVSGAAKALLSL